MERLGASIGRKMRDEIQHIQWIDVTQNYFLTDHNANQMIVSGFKRQKELYYAGLSCKDVQSDHMVRLCVPKKGHSTPMSLNMRNSTISMSAMKYLANALSNYAYYITALSFKFCYLEFSDIMLLADGVKFN